MGGGELAKISLSTQSKRRQALTSRWVGAIWVGIAQRSFEHIAIVEGGGLAVRCKAVKRRPMSSRGEVQTIIQIPSTPRRPNPNDPEDQ